MKFGHTLKRKEIGLVVSENRSGGCSSAVDTRKIEENFTGNFYFFLNIINLFKLEVKTDKACSRHGRDEVCTNNGAKYRQVKLTF